MDWREGLLASLWKLQAILGRSRPFPRLAAVCQCPSSAAGEGNFTVDKFRFDRKDDKTAIMYSPSIAVRRHMLAGEMACPVFRLQAWGDYGMA